MKYDSQDSVRNLFNLPKEEKIYDDFGCSVVDTINHPGRLYLTENFLCFNSTIIGFSTKLTIPFNDITELKKSSKNTIQVNVKGQKKDKYQFTSFKDTLITYKRIKNMCRAYIEKVSPSNKENKVNIILSDSEEDDDEDDILINNNNKNIKEENVIKNNNNDTLKKNNNEQGNILKNSKIDNNTSEENKVSEDDDDEIIDFPPIESNKIENFKVVIDLPIKEFFKKYLTNQFNETCYKSYYESLGDHFNVVITDWRQYNENNENNNEINNNNDLNNNNFYDCFTDNNQKTRNLTFSIHLTGVPFINQSDVKKKQILTIEENGVLKIRGSSMSVGVPYCTYFSVEDQYELYPYKKGTKTILRIINWRNFLKSSLLQSTIEKTCKAEYQKEADSWIQFIKNTGTIVEKYYPPGKKKKKDNKKESKLSHGLEKVQSISQKSQFNYLNIILMLCDKLVNEIDFKTCFLLFFMFVFYVKLSWKISSQKKEIQYLYKILKTVNKKNSLDGDL